MPPTEPEGGFAFDHAEIVARALEILRWGARKGEEHSPALGLLPAPFRKADIRAMLRALGLPEGEAEGWLRRRVKLGQVRPEGRKPVKYQVNAPKA